MSRKKTNAKLTLDGENVLNKSGINSWFHIHMYSYSAKMLLQYYYVHFWNFELRFSFPKENQYSHRMTESDIELKYMKKN